MNSKRSRIISLILAVAMLATMLPFGVFAETTVEEDLFEKFADKGIYTYASQTGDTEYGIRVLSNVTDPAYDYMLYSIDDTEGWTAAGITEETVNAAKSNSCKYVAAVKDGCWKYAAMADGNGVEKDTWYTTKNYRNSGSYRVIGGNIYFGLYNTEITPADKSLTFLIEYLDAGTSSMLLRYCTGGRANNSVVITKTGTNEWKTAVISVTDAALSSTNTDTGLGSGKDDFRIEANSADTYISRVKVLKTSDYLGVEEEDKEIVKPEEDMTKQIFLVGDSICEILTPAHFPREGWGMEIADFFTGEVRFINKAKGGKSTRTFLSGHDPTAGADVYDTRMQDILKASHEGDYLFINLGTNDALNGRDSVKTDATILSDNGDGTSFRANLAKFKQIADENGLIPIFITSARIRSFHSDGTMKDDGIDAYRNAMKEVGQQLGVPVLDLGSAHKALAESLGVNDSTLIYMHTTQEAYPNLPVAYADNTHINQTGAREICKLIVNLIKQGAEAGNATLAGLYNYVDKTKDLSPITKPVYQSYSPSYDVSDVKYIVNGEESDVYYAGEVGATLTVKNNGKISDSATMYLAVYDENGSLTDVSASLPVTLAPGESAQLTADAVTLPDLDGIRFRKYVWSSALKPYSENEIEKLVLSADGYNRKAVLKWTEKADLGEDVTFEIFRDNVYIGKTESGAYIDDDVTRGEHTYQVNAVASDGEVVYQSAIAVAKVTSMDDFDGSVVYTKARLNMNGDEEDINKGLLCYRTSKLYPSIYSQYYYDDLTDEKYTTILESGAQYTHAGSDGPVIVKKVTDDYGITKDAWFTTESYCYTESRPGKEVKSSFMYFNVANKSITPEDSSLTIFVDYLANRSTLSLDYCNFTLDGETINQAKATTKLNDVATNGWRTAKFEITDAYFDQTKTPFFNGATDMRIASGGSDLYISSVVIVKGTGNEALKKYASINPGFTNDVAGTGSELYPDGVSIDFTSGKPVMNGIRNFRREDNANADASAYITQDEDGEYYLTTQPAVNANGTAKQTYAYFVIDDNYMFGIEDNVAEVEMLCKVEYNTPIYWLSNTYYGGVASSNGGKNVAQLQVKEGEPWQTIKFTVDNVSFNNLDNGGGDLRMSITTDLNDPNRQLKIKKLTIRNINSSARNIAQKREGVSLFIAGDSIAAPYASGSTTIGWGMRLPNFVSANVVNKAQPGSSTKTFPNMNSILSSVQEGDYVLMQFGHNDSMLSDPRGVEVDQYKVNLRNYVKNIRKMHAVPVILTSIPRYDVAGNALLCGDGDGIEVYRDAAIEIAEEMGVAYIDVAEKMVEKTADFDAETMVAMFVDEGHNARVHLTESGATFVAELIAAEIKNHEKINVIKDYIK